MIILELVNKSLQGCFNVKAGLCRLLNFDKSYIHILVSILAKAKTMLVTPTTYEFFMEVFTALSFPCSIFMII